VKRRVIVKISENFLLFVNQRKKENGKKVGKRETDTHTHEDMDEPPREEVRRVKECISLPSGKHNLCSMIDNQLKIKNQRRSRKCWR